MLRKMNNLPQMIGGSGFFASLRAKLSGETGFYHGESGAFLGLASVQGDDLRVTDQDIGDLFEGIGIPVKMIPEYDEKALMGQKDPDEGEAFFDVI